LGIHAFGVNIKEEDPRSKPTRKPVGFNADLGGSFNSFGMKRSFSSAKLTIIGESSKGNSEQFQELIQKVSNQKVNDLAASFPVRTNNSERTL
jgi:hypothetical protein